jgi:release factor glutamine methyltransferase
VTRRDILELAANRLVEAGVDDPLREARLVLCAALKYDAAELISGRDEAISADEEQTAKTFIERRAKREPLARIKGRRDFWKSSFLLNEATLEPRADSETLIEAALAYYKGKEPPKRILDLGTGTGCLLLSLLQEFPHAQGVGTDKAPRAIDAAKENAARCGVEDRVGLLATSWATGVNGPFDLVVSNPPYIATREIAELQPEVKEFDPALALDGGEDGLAAYRMLAKTIPTILAPFGVVIVEIGISQESDVIPLFEREGFIAKAQRRDLGGIIRALVFA